MWGFFFASEFYSELQDINLGLTIGVFGYLACILTTKFLTDTVVKKLTILSALNIFWMIILFSCREISQYKLKFQLETYQLICKFCKFGVLARTFRIKLELPRCKLHRLIPLFTDNSFETSHYGLSGIIQIVFGFPLFLFSIHVIIILYRKTILRW